jgi:hypothetical protein
LDGRSLAYCAKEQDKYFVVVGGTKLDDRYEEPIDCIYFSPDSSVLSFGAFDGTCLWWHVVTLSK